NTRDVLVGAPRFELGTSCAQGRRNISWKSFLFNLSFENKRVKKIFGSGTVCRNVAPHAWSPPQFPPQRETAKCIRRLLTVESHQPFGKQFLTQRFHFPTALHPSRDNNAMQRLRRTSHTRRPHGTARLFHRSKLWRQE